jgi:mannose-6-phosphate isomerase-like protein (cupin superfamily)
MFNNRDEGGHMHRVNEKECKFRVGDWGVKYILRGPRIDWGIILLKSGKTMGAHGHKEVEETFYFIKGSPKILVNDVEYRVKEGDAFRLEPLEKHDIVNDTQEEVKLIFIKTPYLPEDKITY